MVVNVTCSLNCIINVLNLTVLYYELLLTVLLMQFKCIIITVYKHMVVNVDHNNTNLFTIYICIHFILPELFMYLLIFSPSCMLVF